MTNDERTARCASHSCAAQAHSLRSAAARLGRGVERTTPDATRGCRAGGPQSQQRCGLAPTTPPRGVDHEATTVAATH